MYELWRETACPYRPQFTQVEGRKLDEHLLSEFMMWGGGGSQWGTATPKIGGAFASHSMEHKAVPCPARGSRCLSAPFSREPDFPSPFLS